MGLEEEFVAIKCLGLDYYKVLDEYEYGAELVELTLEDLEELPGTGLISGVKGELLFIVDKAGIDIVVDRIRDFCKQVIVYDIDLVNGRQVYP